jgi:nitrate reductase NapE
MQDTQHHTPSLTAEQQLEKKKERRLFIFIIVFLFPILTVAIVGAMGFSIWFYQLIAGPPGPY